METQLSDLKALKSDDTIRKKLVTKYAQVPTLVPAPGGGAGHVMGLKALAGMGGKEMDMGAIFAKYYGLAKLAEEIQDPAHLDQKLANIGAITTANATIAAKNSKDAYASAI